MEARINKWQDDVKEELKRQRQEALFKVSVEIIPQIYDKANHDSII